MKSYLNRIKFPVFSLFFFSASLAVMTGCLGPKSLSSEAPVSAKAIADGLYVFHAFDDGDRDGEREKMLYNNCPVKLTNKAGGIIHVDVLAQRGGSFDIKNTEGRLEIMNSNIAFAEVQRSIEGNGTLQSGNRGSGRWLLQTKSIGRFSRNFRKGDWTLKLATPEQIEQHKQNVERLESRARAKERALY